MHIANKIKNTQFYIFKCFNYQNYLFLRYCMFHNIEICTCIKSEICISALKNCTKSFNYIKLYFNYILLKCIWYKLEMFEYYLKTIS